MSIYSNIEEYLAAKNIKPTVRNAKSLEWYMSLGNRSRIYCDLKEEAFGWVINMCFPVTADCSVLEEMQKAAEFVTRVNLVINSGCFELDWKTGEVKFRYHFAISKDMANYENIKNILEYVSGIVYTYENAFFSTLFSNNDVESHVVSCKPPCFPALIESEEVENDIDEDDDCPPDWGSGDDIIEEELYDDDDDSEDDYNYEIIDEEFYDDNEDEGE